MSFGKNVPTATVQLDRPRKIAFTLDALLRLEEVTGTPFVAMGIDAGEIVKKLDAWIWSGLDDADRGELSVTDIRQMIHLGNLASAVNAVTALITKSLPDVPEDVPEGNAAPGAVKKPTPGSRKKRHA